MKISIVINCDTRKRNDTFTGTNLGGVVNEDFLTHGIANKISFFSGFDKEVIVSVDEHVPLSKYAFEYLQLAADTLVIRKHTNEHSFNDWNYLRSLKMATGEVVIKIDQDTTCFTSSKEHVENLIKLLDDYSFVSYPSIFSPHPDHNPNYDYFWSSTRYMMYKRKDVDLYEIERMLLDYNYCYEKYPASVRNHWLEHACGLWAKYKGKGVYYPKIEIEKYAIFSWANYRSGVLQELNKVDYKDIELFLQMHPIGYPNDVTI